MTDERYVAIQTERERKNVANSARKRKTHNGKSGCTLPHESMTRKELLSMNGEVQKVNLSKPMSWEEFKGLSSSLQEAYIYQLVKKYDISMNMFCKMVNRAYSTVFPWMKDRPELKKLFNSSRNKSDEQRAKNKEFWTWIAVNDIPENIKAKVEGEKSDIKDVYHEDPHDLPGSYQDKFPESASTHVTLPETKKYYPIKTYTQAQVNELLLRQKVDIYESIIDRLLSKDITLTVKEAE